ncbi:FAD-binding dehydrogenase [Epidermidibacterium keratini]|uniref:FAD-binding dehydrogenase n=1 Tax=Epidermidibacterium keratini TaxID=1891644 RepID=A0A7L4YN82_9ACTN|nr:FAD-binding dehydrogenase [Epidermidibacterium keratini]QHC00735.1 FAD-binding dehydrogenase [Epidermidibacterium keratini]
MNTEVTDVVVVGAGLAGLVAASELIDAGRDVILLDQENEANLGGQAFWSFGGLFLIDTPEQRRMGISDSVELAQQDWLGTAGFDRPEDDWARKWAEAYVEFAAGEKREWLHELGMRWFPMVGWAERGGYGAVGHGNSVPRFHVTWGTGPGVVEPFVRKVRAAVERGQVRLRFRYRVTGLLTEGDAATGVHGDVLAPDDAARGVPSSRDVVDDFSVEARHVVVTSGGIGANHELVRKYWPASLGTPPQRMVTGVPAYVDGQLREQLAADGARLVNADRMWHYTEGLKNFDPIWPSHGIRILPGPSSLWFDGGGRRLPVPLFPGFDTLGTLRHLRQTGYDYSWFVLTQKVIEKEFALSGSEQNPDLTGKDVRLVLQRILPGAPGPVEAFKERGEDFVVADTLDELLAAMQALEGGESLDVDNMRREVLARDREMDNDFTKDLQVTALRGARNYRGDKLGRVATPHKFTDPAAGPLIGVRLHTLTRKSLGGLQTDLSGRVLRPDGSVFRGLYAAGEVAGFGGGGMHGYRSLEGTFLGGCIFSGRQAGRGAAFG